MSASTKIRRPVGVRKRLQGNEYKECPDDTPLVGYAISFPASDGATPISYQVNHVSWEQEYGAYAADDDEEDGE